jgi:hypothetical protein
VNRFISFGVEILYDLVEFLVVLRDSRLAGMSVIIYGVDSIRAPSSDRACVWS